MQGNYNRERERTQSSSGGGQAVAARSGVASTLPSSLSDLWTRHSLQAVAGRLRVSDGFPKISAQADVKLAPTPSIMDNKHKAMQGWLTDSPPPPWRPTPTTKSTRPEQSWKRSRNRAHSRHRSADARMCDLPRSPCLESSSHRKCLERLSRNGQLSIYDLARSSPSRRGVLGCDQRFCGLAGWV